jgi:hypothetical protein
MFRIRKEFVVQMGMKRVCYCTGIMSVVCRSGKNHIYVDPVPVTSIRLMREDGIMKLGFMVLL